MSPRRLAALAGLFTSALLVSGCWDCSSNDECPEGSTCDELGGVLVRKCVSPALPDAIVPPECPEECYPTEGGLADPTNGVGECRAGTPVCQDGGLVECMGAVLPTAELCDGLDNDCDGVADEPPEEEGFPCYPTADGLADPAIGVGECVAGTATCLGGELGECVGAVVPMAEVCNGDDDDCDGAVDGVGADGPPLERSCARAADCPDNLDDLLPQAPDDRRCCVGIQQCEMGAWGECRGGNGQGQRAGEVCNGLDDDCDGNSDERWKPGQDDVPADPIEEDPGRRGEMEQLGFDCVSFGLPGEVDVDGAEDVTPGACRRYGRITCDPSAEAVACSAVAVDPGVEKCTIPSVPDDLYLPQPGSERVGDVPENAVINHADEDCDDRTDEFTVPQGVTVADNAVVGDACSIGLGACLSPAVLRCNEAGDVVCNAEVRQPGVEVCGGPDGLNDEDCDGRFDEAELDVPLTEACGTSLGVCVAGTRTCAGGRFGVCVPVGDASTEADPAVPEWCDGKNNDCDGAPQDADPAIDSDGLVDELCSCSGPEMDPGAINSDLMVVRTRPMGNDRANVLNDRANVLRGSCGGDDAPEVVLSWTSPSRGLWRFRARDAADNGSDPVVYLTPSCSTSALEPPSRDERVEVACGDDDGAMQILVIPGQDGGPPSSTVEFPDTTRLGASAVVWTAGPDGQAPAETFSVVLDGATGEGGDWTLETQRIDRGPLEPGPDGAMLNRPKVLVIEGPMDDNGMRVSGVRRDNSQCSQRIVHLDKSVDPVEVHIQDGVSGPCLDNDGGYRALQLDGGGLVRDPLGAGQTISVFGRLLPQAVDSADWFSVRLADLGAFNRNINIDLIPPTGVLPDGVDPGFAGDRQRCLGERTRLVAYVACREGMATVDGVGCRRDELTGVVVCDDVVRCIEPGNAGQAGRYLGPRLGDPVCRAEDGSPVDGDPILFVGVLRADRELFDCTCGERGPPPNRSVTYELTISRP